MFVVYIHVHNVGQSDLATCPQNLGLTLVLAVTDSPFIFNKRYSWGLRPVRFLSLEGQLPLPVLVTTLSLSRYEGEQKGSVPSPSWGFFAAPRRTNWSVYKELCHLDFQGMLTNPHLGQPFFFLFTGNHRMKVLRSPGS